MSDCDATIRTAISPTTSARSVPTTSEAMRCAICFLLGGGALSRSSASGASASDVSAAGIAPLAIIAPPTGQTTLPDADLDARIERFHHRAHPSLEGVGHLDFE